ncbi:phosphopantothenoylcysteine decarboxylase domain-containing protein, partial [Helicobacter sp. CLO-3]|uniref:phosphopantothenoylcysteine decarboxylase domain-containing protein n=1 Tax=Helicobacter sp. CLO-3 TaxID=211 RepID=UPI003F8CD61D
MRAITNHSSGLQASCLAIALYTLGARVTLISSAFPLKLPSAVRQIRVQTNAEYKNALESIAQKYRENLENMRYLEKVENLKNGGNLGKADSENADSKNLDSRAPKSSQKIILFMAAALVDFAPLNPQAHKIKKASLDSRGELDSKAGLNFGKAESKIAPESKKIPESSAPNLTLQLKINDDILSSLDSSVFVKIGFKAEDDTKEAIINAQKMLLDVNNGGKGCKAVCLNTIPYTTPRAQNQAHQKPKIAESKSLESKAVDLDSNANPFGSAKNSFLLLDEKSLKDARHIVKLAQKDKLTLSYEIADFVKSHLVEWDNESPKKQILEKAESKKPSAESKNTKAQDFAPKNNKNIKNIN